MPSDETIEAAAKAAHMVNRAYRNALGQAPGLPWIQAPRHVQDTVIDSVRLILEDPTTGPEVLHQRWLDNMRAAGWTWGQGPRICIEHKKHPGLISWEQLPPWERAKDVIFGAVVRGVLEYHGATDA